jgi:hypothetical protein
MDENIVSEKETLESEIGNEKSVNFTEEKVITSKNSKQICPNCHQEIGGDKKYKIPEYTRRAIKKYHEKNKEVILEKIKINCKNKYDNDEAYREHKKQKSRERYLKLKQQQEQKNKEQEKK